MIRVGHGPREFILSNSTLIIHKEWGWRWIYSRIINQSDFHEGSLEVFFSLKSFQWKFHLSKFLFYRTKGRSSISQSVWRLARIRKRSRRKAPALPLQLAIFNSSFFCFAAVESINKTFLREEQPWKEIFLLSYFCFRTSFRFPLKQAKVSAGKLLTKALAKWNSWTETKAKQSSLTQQLNFTRMYRDSTA